MQLWKMRSNYCVRGRTPGDHECEKRGRGNVAEFLEKDLWLWWLVACLDRMHIEEVPGGSSEEGQLRRHTGHTRAEPKPRESDENRPQTRRPRRQQIFRLRVQFVVKSADDDDRISG